VFAPISAILGLLFFVSTLPNGIRLSELPAGGDSVEILAGYSTGGLSGLVSTSGARALLTEAYAAGGSIELVSELDRTALRITAPKWALPMLLERLPALFKEVPEADAGARPVLDFRAMVEEEIRSALLGSSPALSPYATSDAFVLISAPIPNSLRDELAGITKRGSAARPDDQISRLPAERTLRFKSDLPEGAVIFASPIPGVYYKQWYLVLLLDRLIQRSVPLALKTSLPLTVRPHYYRLELKVPAGQFPEPAEENLLQEVQRLQFTAANARDLAAARQETLDYLETKGVREWFASQDLAERRVEGVQWIQSMTADDMRVAARDLLIMNRVVATWAPKPRQTAVAVESLTAAVRSAPPASSVPGSRREGPQGESAVKPFPPHTDPALSTTIPERLASGVSLVASTINAVFVSGGPFTRLEHEMTGENVRAFQQYRADRILVLAPESSLARTRDLWASFRGNSLGETGVPKGKISSVDLSALFILKTLIDLKLLEAGWWSKAEVGINAGEGSSLEIRADEEIRAQILDWIKAIANGSTPQNYLSWAREIAIHRFNSALADIQALTWERDSQGAIQDPATVLPSHVQDVARIYF
jgi:hypothetical protein